MRNGEMQCQTLGHKKAPRLLSRSLELGSLIAEKGNCPAVKGLWRGQHAEQVGPTAGCGELREASHHHMNELVRFGSSLEEVAVLVSLSPETLLEELVPEPVS